MQKAFPIFAMELFCDGWLFLTHSDVTWDGSSHAVKRIRVNTDKSEGLLGHAREHFTDVPSNIDLCQYVGTTLVEPRSIPSLSFLAMMFHPVCSYSLRAI